MVEKILSQLEKLAFWLQIRYMSKRRTCEVVEPGRIRFHPHDCRKEILEKYQKTLKKLGI